MGELFEKLSRRRCVIEESAFQFESEPSASVADHQNPCSAQPTPRSPTLSATTPCGDDASKRRPRTGADFRSVIDRQRTLVDEIGTSFESEPHGRTADAGELGHGLQRQVSAEPESETPGGTRPSRIVDFHTVIDRQRTFVEEGGKTFESNPGSKTADSGHDRASAQAEGNQLKVQSKGKQAKEPSLLFSCNKGSAAVDSAASAGLGGIREVQEEAAEAGQSSGSRKAERRAEKRAARRAEAPVGSLMVTGNRVAWLCSLGEVDGSRTLRENYSSPPFKLGSCEQCSLRYHSQGASGCGAELSLHGSLGEAGVRVALFLGDQMTNTQDWAKDQKSLFFRHVQHIPIPDAESFWKSFVNDFPEELRQQFVSTRKDRVLCGLAYTAGGVWLDGGVTPRIPKKR